MDLMDIKAQSGSPPARVVPVQGAAVDVPVVAVASTTPVAQVWLLLGAEAKNGAFRHLISFHWAFPVEFPHQFAHVIPDSSTNNARRHWISDACMARIILCLGKWQLTCTRRFLGVFHFSGHLTWP